MIVEAYIDACEKPSDINEHLPTFVDLCVSLNAKTVIELGTRGGVSTIAWLYGLELTDGHLWSVDVDPKPALDHERWTFIQGSDLDPSTLERLPKQADIVFVDTSHDYQQTKAELNVYKWRVRPGGRIVLHDTALPHPEGWTRDQPKFPVGVAVDEFCKEERFKVRYWQNCFGLGVIHIPGVSDD